jgi:protein TonB
MFRRWSALMLAAWVLPPTPLAAEAPTPTPPPAIKTAEPRKAQRPVTNYVGPGGSQISVAFQGEIVQIRSSEGWDGVGLLDGNTYYGVFRYRTSNPATNGARGVHTIDWSNVSDLGVQTTYTAVMTGTVEHRWRLTTRPERPAPSAPPPNIVVAPPGSDERPKLGDYVYVEELPEAITKVPPAYPPNAREARVQGTVMVQALVLKDGSVGETKIVHSIPELDAAAEAAVRQWKFKPALSKGQPVVVWVAVPVKFSLH